LDQTVVGSIRLSYRGLAKITPEVEPLARLRIREAVDSEVVESLARSKRSAQNGALIKQREKDLFSVSLSDLLFVISSR